MTDGMDSFKDIVREYSKRKPSSFSFEKKAGDFERRLLTNQDQGVQGGYFNTNESRTQDRIVPYDEARDAIGGNQIYEAPHKPNSKGRSRTGYRMYGGRSPNQQLIYTRDIYGNTGYRTGRPDVVLGNRDAPVHMYTPKWNIYQPPSAKYGLTVQNFTEPYISRYGRHYIDWEGNLTDDRSKAALIDTWTGEELTEPPAELPVEEFGARYRPVMAATANTIYSMGEEKDAYHEMELQRNREYIAAYETQKQIQKLMDETGLPESFFMEQDPESGVSIYEQVLGAISARNDAEEDEIRKRMEERDLKYKEMTDKASELAQKRLEEHIAQYKEFMENPDAYIEPVKQPKGIWVFGTGDFRNKGHYSFAPQLRQYYKEELAKLMGAPIPEPEDEFDPIKYYNDIVGQYPEMAEVLSGLDQESWELLYDTDFDFSQYYTQGPDGQQVLRQGITPSTVADQIDMIVGEEEYHTDYDATHRKEALDEIENNRIRDLENHVENRIRIQRRAYARAGMKYTPEQEAKDRERYAKEVSVYETPKQAQARMHKEMLDRVEQKMEALLQNHDKNRDDPIEPGRGMGALASNYKGLHKRIIDMNKRIQLATENGQSHQYILQMQAERDSMQAKLDKMKEELLELAHAAGISPGTGKYSVFKEKSGTTSPIVVDEFDDEGYINPYFMDAINGPKRRYDHLLEQSRAEIYQNDLLNRIRETGKAPKMFDPQEYVSGNGKKKRGARVLPGEENMYDQTATDIYWKLYGHNGLTSGFQEELDRAVQGTEFQVKRQARSDAKREQIREMNAAQSGRTKDDENLAVVNLHKLVDWAIKPQYREAAHEWVREKGLRAGFPEEMYMTPKEGRTQVAVYMAKLYSIPPEVREELENGSVGEKGGDNRGLADAKYARLGRLFADTIKRNVAPPYQGLVAKMISDNPANNWQGILKMLTDPKNLPSDGVWIGDPKQVAYTAQYFINAKDDKDGGNYTITSKKVKREVDNAADKYIKGLLDKNGQVKVPDVEIPKGEGDPYEGKARTAAIRQGDVSPENIAANKKRIKAAEEAELTANSAKYQPQPTERQVTEKQWREAVAATKVEENNKAAADAEASARSARIVADEQAQADAERKATDQAEFRDELINTEFPKTANADVTGRKAAARKLMELYSKGRESKGGENKGGENKSEELDNGAETGDSQGQGV